MLPLLLSLFLTTPQPPLPKPSPPLHLATCVGADPCKACKNCHACKHCKKDGGTCGACKKK